MLQQLGFQRLVARRTRQERNRLMRLILDYSQEQERLEVACREMEHRQHILERDLAGVRRAVQILQERRQQQEAQANQETRYQDNLEQAVNPHLEAYLQEQGVEMDTDTEQEEQEAQEESESD